MKVGDLVRWTGFIDEENDVGLIIKLFRTWPRRVVVQWSKDTSPEIYDWDDFNNLREYEIEVIE